MLASKTHRLRVSRLNLNVTFTWLAATDALVFFISWYLAAWITFQLHPSWLSGPAGGLYFKAAVFSGMTALAMCSMGLYEPRLREQSRGILFRTISAFALMALGMTVLILLFPVLSHWRGVLVYSAAIAFAGSLFTRAIFTRTANMEKFKRRVLVIGTGHTAVHIANKMRRKSDHHGFQVVGYFPVPGDFPVSEESPGVDGIVPDTSDQSIFEYARSHSIHEIVVALDNPCETTPEEELRRCRRLGIPVHSMMDFFEQEASKVLLEEASAEWFAFARGFGKKTFGYMGKRAFDITSSIFLLMLAWPLMLFTVCAIKLEDGIRAPVFFLQNRVGLNGRIFSVMKFRSMSVDAEADGKARWATANDARVTQVGKIIRKIRVDELPQIINVLVGDMAFVGPRPERPEFVSELAKEIRYFDKRHTVKPGITGWAQINYPYGSSVTDAIRKLEFDLYYVKHQSLLLDFLVLLQTLEVVLFRKGVR